MNMSLDVYRKVMQTLNDSRRISASQKETQKLLEKYGLTLENEPNQGAIDQAAADSLFKSVDDFEKFLRE